MVVFRPPLLALSLLLACGDDWSEPGDPSVGSPDPGVFGETPDAGGGEPEPTPSTPQACFDAYLSDRGSTCFGDCGPAMGCVNQFDCVTCSDQCIPPGCSTDAECQEQFGDLCPGVQWVCEQWQLDLHCTVDFGGGSDDPPATGCDAGDPFECVGADLLDCTTNDLYDCELECQRAGYSAAADPPCGLSAEGYESCLCV